MQSFDQHARWTKDVISVLSGIIGIFVFVTGTQSLPSLLRGNPPDSGSESVFSSGLPVSLKISLFLTVFAVFYLGIFFICRYCKKRWLRENIHGGEQIVVLIVSFLLIMSIDLVIIDSFLGPFEAVFEKDDPTKRQAIVALGTTATVFTGMVVAHANLGFSLK